MRLSATTLLVVSVAVLSACAPAIHAPAAPDPTGQYQFSSVVDGQPFTGTIRIFGEPGAYRAAIRTNIAENFDLDDVTMEGNTIRIRGTDAGAPEMDLVVEGQTIRGSWRMGPYAGELTGTRTPPAAGN